MPVEAAGEKVCRKCEKLLPVERFSIRYGTQIADCKGCVVARVVQWRVKNREKYLALKTRSEESFKRRRPEVLRARRQLQRAVRLGTISRPGHCTACPAICVPEGHHPDYTKPLQVNWLCRKCHRKLHREER